MEVKFNKIKLNWTILLSNNSNNNNLPQGKYNQIIKLIKKKRKYNKIKKIIIKSLQHSNSKIKLNIISPNKANKQLKVRYSKTRAK